MDFMTAVKTCLTKWSDFNGKAGRAEFWYFFVACFIASLVLGMIPIVGMLTILLIIPQLAVGTRRLHDIGKSGWLQLLLLIPLVGFIILAILWAKK